MQKNGYLCTAMFNPLRTINLLERSTAGRVVIGGTDITGFTGSRLRTLRLGTGMIFQQFNLINIRTVLIKDNQI